MVFSSNCSLSAVTYIYGHKQIMYRMCLESTEKGKCSIFCVDYKKTNRRGGIWAWYWMKIRYLNFWINTLSKEHSRHNKKHIKRIEF